jgi:hypothetical protein
VLGELVYLGNGGEQVTVQADAAALQGCKEEMRRSIEAMRAALEDPVRNLARIERFPQLQGRDACHRCPFRRPCGRL